MWLSLPLVEWYLYRFIIPYAVLVTHFHSLGRWFKIFMYVGYVVSTCDVIYYLQETINNSSQSVGGTGDDYFHKPFTSFYSFKSLIAAFEDSGLPLNTKESIFLLPCLLYLLSLVYIIFRVTNEVIRKFFQRSDNDEWHGRWEKIGQVLKEYSSPVVWKFTPEQIQDPVKVAEYLKEKRCGGSREEQLTALCWALATLYRTLLDTSQSPQEEEEEEEEENRPTGTMATQTAAAPEERPMPGAVAPRENTLTSRTKVVCLVRDEEETESSEEEEEAELQILSESQRKLQDIRQRFTRLPDQSLLLWLYECWFAGANVEVFLNGYEARQLGSLSRDVAIDRGIGRRMGTLSLWRRLVGSVREAHTADEMIVYRDRWNTKLEGVHYLTELAMVDILYWNTRNARYIDDPDEAYCTWRVWEAFRKSAPPFYAKALSSITWHRDLKVEKLKAYVWDYIPKPSSLPQDSYVGIQPKEYAASSDDPCTICHEELSRNTCELECGHEFHRECIRTWLQEHSSTCPICRDYAVLPTDVPERPAWNNSKHYKAKAWKRSVF